MQNTRTHSFLVYCAHCTTAYLPPVQVCSIGPVYTRQLMCVVAEKLKIKRQSIILCKISWRLILIDIVECNFMEAIYIYNGPQTKKVSVFGTNTIWRSSFLCVLLCWLCFISTQHYRVFPVHRSVNRFYCTCTVTVCTHSRQIRSSSVTKNSWTEAD